MARTVKDNTKDKMYAQFASTNKYVVPITQQPSETTWGVQDMVRWGTYNTYPSYLYSIYENAPTLYAIINSVVDYTLGEGIENDMPIFDKKQADGLIRDMAFSYALYGGIALQVTRSHLGNVADIDVLDLRCVRTTEDNSKFYYSKNYKGSYDRHKEVILPRFEKDSNELVSVYYYKNSRFKTYPSPLYAAAVRSAQCEEEVQTYNLSSVKNGFNATHLIQFNNGIPSDDAKAQIEKNSSEKFNGTANAGGVIMMFNNSKEQEATVTTLEQESFADKYAALNGRVRQDLFTAFRCHPNIMGIPSEGTGFAGEEYEQTFKLFNRMTIKPIQNIIKSIFKDILGVDIEIIPFNLN